MNVLLIGASGFVGTRLIKELGHEYVLKNFDKRESKEFNAITFVGDIRNPEPLNVCMQNKDCVILLAAEHKDDVTPISLYYDVNVKGTENVLEAMDNNGVKNIIFTSSVAVYGLNKDNPDEEFPTDPFNHYGQSKWYAEEALRKWYARDPENRSLTIIRPTVIFGENNRGNVFNLFKQIASGHFVMVGKGNNKKSMAYIGNVVAFIKYYLDNMNVGYQIFNYVDKPDYSMNELVGQVEKSLKKKISPLRFPYWLGLVGGLGIDVLSYFLRKKFSVSFIRIKKFCATTQFDSTKAHSNGFKNPYSLADGLDRTLKYEFLS